VNRGGSGLLVAGGSAESLEFGSDGEISVTEYQQDENPLPVNKVTVSRSIQIDAPPDAVWDYTQNWRRRHEWDHSVVNARYLSEKPPVTVQVEGKGGLKFKVSYKTMRRPHLTSLVMSDVDSFWVRGGGGSWKYEDNDGKALWTQHNTVVLRDDLLGRIVRPLFALILAVTTRRQMTRAKGKIENRHKS
jgi:hypothetical protein